MCDFDSMCWLSSFFRRKTKAQSVQRYGPSFSSIFRAWAFPRKWAIPLTSEVNLMSHSLHTRRDFRIAPHARRELRALSLSSFIRGKERGLERVTTTWTTNDRKNTHRYTQVHTGTHRYTQVHTDEHHSGCRKKIKQKTPNDVLGLENQVLMWPKVRFPQW